MAGRRTAAPRVRARGPEIRKGDTVVVLAGKDAGKRGVVERVIRGTSGPTVRGLFRRGAAHSGITVVVEGLNIAKRHQKPRPPRPDQTTGRVPASQQGGILDIPQPMSVSKVMLVCPKCSRPTRIAHRTLENGRRIRVCRHCGEALEVTAS
jgi:large subunit ribosomal protein L24